ncbi:MAG: glycosyltransferase, partial [Kiritimatiellae bacterium]|nr:glycosyltransferase [Kiritimatiellia bacterium]MDW8459539.1 glycosyltransferase [Verrucomicrobiota bacterium]
HAVAVVANAKAIVEHFAKCGAPRQRFRLIPNILDTREFDEEARRGFPGKIAWEPTETIIKVARLDREKDHETFLRAAARVSARRPTAQFLLAGDGAERARLERLCQKLDLTGRVFFLGEVTEIPALLRTVAIGALTPSRNEGLSNTIMEYMAARLPIVATDVGGNRELVDPPRGGFLVAPGDDSAIAEALVRLLEDPLLRADMGVHNRARVEREFQPAIIAGHFCSLYADVLRGAGR